MQAVVFRSHGDRDVIDYETVADPEVGPDEVRVDVKAGALNHPCGATSGPSRETLPMSETAEGHRLLEDREGFGKVVVVPDSEL